MGLSEEEKAKIPYLVGKELEKATDEPEFIETNKAFDEALLEYVYQNLRANFKARKWEPSTFRVVQGTFQITDQISKMIWRKLLPHITEEMLKKFDLVKKKSSK